MIRNVIFDIGGVLVDDGDAVLEKYLELAPEEMKALSKLVYGDVRWRDGVMLGELSQQTYLAELVEQYPEWKELLEKMLSYKDQAKALPIKPAALSFMRRLKLSDKYKIYFLSNLSDTSYEYLKNILDEFDGGAYSFQEGIMKTDERFYQVLLSRYKLDPREAIFFDDREANIVAAEKLGIASVLVKGTDDLLAAGLL